MPLHNPYGQLPVASVNGKSNGNVVLGASDVGAVASSGGIADDILLERAKFRQAPDIIIGTGTATVNYSNGDWQKIVAQGSIAVDFASFPAGFSAAAVIEAVGFGDNVITWPSGTNFKAGTPPVIPSGARALLLVLKDASENYTVLVAESNLAASA